MKVGFLLFLPQTQGERMGLALNFLDANECIHASLGMGTLRWEIALH